MLEKAISKNSKLHDLGFIFFRNIFLLTNAIIFAVVILLFVFGANQAAIFLGVLSVFNISIGLVQDIHSWNALDKLQSLTAPQIVRRKSDGSTEIILADQIKKNDIIVLKIGDQIPCDGTLLEALAFEINEGLITGESNSIPQKVGDKLQAGCVVTSGSGIFQVETLSKDSRIARMTSGIKKYAANTSSIQRSVEYVIKNTGYVLVVVLVIVFVRGILIDQTAVEMVLNVAALTSIIVPQGLVFAVTLFFAYGAAHLFRQHVLLQEVNATEKLGRIKNLCMDKTGTLTENFLTVEAMHLPPKMTEEEASKLTDAYLSGTNDTSQTIQAVRKFLEHNYDGEIADTLAFSSWRQYGAVVLKKDRSNTCVLVGAPITFIPHLKTATEKRWLENILNTHSAMGKSIVAVVRNNSSTFPENLSETKLSIVAVFVFFNNLRPGIKDTISFFQDRGVKIRIISGDNKLAACAVAASAGIKNSSSVITGEELLGWSDSEYTKKITDFTIFAQIVPEQKEKIIQALKKHGFTAMVGDGANDALAIKKADLGIAMFDGAPATRQLASVVLTNNSFAALPGGVELADNIIRNIEIFGSVFLNQAFLGFFFFCIISVNGHAFPLTPFNITLINYCAVATPGVLISYWTLRPNKKATKVSEKSFLKRVAPFSFFAALIQSLAAAAIYFLNQTYGQATESNTAVLITFCVLGYIFFVQTPRVYNGLTTALQKKQLVLFGLIDLLILFIAFRVPFFFSFFNLSSLSMTPLMKTIMITIVIFSGVGEYLLARYFTPKIVD